MQSQSESSRTCSNLSLSPSASETTMVMDCSRRRPPTPPTLPTPPTPPTTLSSTFLGSLIGLRLGSCGLCLGSCGLCLGFSELLFFLSYVLLLQSTHLHIIHHPCFRKLGSVGAWCAFPGVLLADISSFDFRYLTSCQGRFALVSRSVKQSNRKLFCCAANSRIGIQLWCRRP